MILETRRLILRPWEETDAEELYCHAKDPMIGPAAGWPPHTSVEDSLGIIRNIFFDEYTFAVVPKAVSKAVGCVRIMRGAAGTAHKQEDEAEIGYWIGRQYWGQGLIPEAVRELLRVCFEELSCSGVWCGYYEGNDKSRRVQEKCGFVPHHKEENVPCEKMGDVRNEYFTYMDTEQWMQIYRT